MRKYIINSSNNPIQEQLNFNIIDDHILEEDINVLISWLNNYLNSNNYIKEGELLQIGWMVCLIKQKNDNSLSLFEPDLISSPIMWTDTLDSTIKVLRIQKDIVESYTDQNNIMIPSCRESCIVDYEYFESKDLLLERKKPDGNDSGWFICNANTNKDLNNPKNLLRKSLYEIGCNRKEIIQFLGLPDGHRIIFSMSNKIIEVEYNGSKIMPKKNSLISKYRL